MVLFLSNYNNTAYSVSTALLAKRKGRKLRTFCGVREKDIIRTESRIRNIGLRAEEDEERIEKRIKTVQYETAGCQS